MRLLFDQNLSARLVLLLADLYPNSAHVRLLGMIDADDAIIWEYAGQHGLLIVSKDSDFYHRAMRYGPPPKVIWIRAGNCTTERIAELLREHYDAVAGFADEPLAAFLPLG
jgi:predicted nuclease of predicted toxin-antitoxin system